MPSGLNGVVAIAAGGASTDAGHSLALKTDGTVVAWGGNFSGQISVPAGLNNVVAIAAGGRHSLALKGDGTVVSWGLFYFNYGASTVPAGLRGVAAIAAGGDVDLVLFDTTPLNHAPITGKCPFATRRDRPNVLDVAELLRVSSDPDGDALSVTAVSATSTSGGTVVLSTNAITYTPPSGFTGTDTFTYTLTDARQATVLGTVTVKVIAPDGNRPSFFRVTANSTNVTVRLLGIPGQAYQFEASTDLVNWVNVGQATAGSNGLFEFTDRDKSLYPFRYYRVTE